jgi:nitroreductase
MGKARRWVEDCSIAAEHILLQAADMGLGACWLQIRGSALEGRSAEEYVREILNVPENMRILCLISVGWPAEKKAPHTEKEFEKAKVHCESF